MAALEKRTPGDGKPARIIVVTSGKGNFGSLTGNRSDRVVDRKKLVGGVGKTTTSASLALGLASSGFRVCAIDFDIGLRNLDLHFVRCLPGTAVSLSLSL
jgi:septum formation inhibitor-activating ATPase MinD